MSLRAQLRKAHRRLRDRAGLNYVHLSDLRAALPDVDRAVFDAEVECLMRQGCIWLHTHDGRHGVLTPEQLAAALELDGRRFVAIAMNDTGGGW